MMKNIMTLIVCCSFVITAHTQEIKNQTDRISDLQIARIKHMFGPGRDSVFSKFDSALYQLTINSELCSYKVEMHDRFIDADSLDPNDSKTLAYAFMNNIVVCFADDKKAKILSTDDLNGGSGHTYTTFLAYETKENDCFTIPIDTSTTSIDVGYYKMYRMPVADKTVYLLLGYGTYGSGAQHYKLRMVELKNGHCLPYPGFDKGTDNILIGMSRNHNPDLNYFPEETALFYNKFDYDPDTGMYLNTFELIALEFKNGKFQ